MSGKKKNKGADAKQKASPPGGLPVVPQAALEAAKVEAPKAEDKKADLTPAQIQRRNSELSRLVAWMLAMDDRFIVFWRAEGYLNFVLLVLNLSRRKDRPFQNIRQARFRGADLSIEHMTYARACAMVNL
jgi:hypothetical protein